MTTFSRRNSLGSARRGSALLSVLWLAAALAAVCFSLASTVRSETDRATTQLEATRAYYVAVGAAQQAYLEMYWEYNFPNGKPRFEKPAVTLDYEFPEGVARVDVITESSKLDINTVGKDQLTRLAMALGQDAGSAAALADAILHWRGGGGEGGEGLDAYYKSLTPSFQPEHTSFQEIEELLQVKGVTPELYYGTYAAAEGGGPRLKKRDGLVDCLTPYKTEGAVDANSASIAVLAALGMSPAAADALVAQRKVKRFDAGSLGAFLASVGGGVNLRVEGASIVNFRATAHPRLPGGKIGELKRSVAVQVKYMPEKVGDRIFDERINILRWQDVAWSE